MSSIRLWNVFSSGLLVLPWFWTFKHVHKLSQSICKYPKLESNGPWLKSVKTSNNNWAWIRDFTSLSLGWERHFLESKPSTNGACGVFDVNIMLLIIQASTCTCLGLNKNRFLWWCLSDLIILLIFKRIRPRIFTIMFDRCANKASSLWTKVNRIFWTVGNGSS